MKQEIKITLEDGNMSIEHSDSMNINDSAYMLLTATAATMWQGEVSRESAVKLFNDAYSQAEKVLSDVDDLPSE
ncbi:hypothetical protein [Lactobacillus phage Sabazios]|nr:hypothetical protein [Lactobacillus phage Sabazios]